MRMEINTKDEEKYSRIIFSYKKYTQRCEEDKKTRYKGKKQRKNTYDEGEDEG